MDNLQLVLNTVDGLGSISLEVNGWPNYQVLELRSPTVSAKVKNIIKQNVTYQEMLNDKVNFTTTPSPQPQDEGEDDSLPSR